jgi:hypothetical protein
MQYLDIRFLSPLRPLLETSYYVYLDQVDPSCLIWCSLCHLKMSAMNHKGATCLPGRLVFSRNYFSLFLHGYWILNCSTFIFVDQMIKCFRHPLQRRIRGKSWRSFRLYGWWFISLGYMDGDSYLWVLLFSYLIDHFSFTISLVISIITLLLFPGCCTLYA